MMGHLEIEFTVLMGLAAIGIISYLKLWPSIEAIHGVADLLNTKGGIILVLWITSMVFFFTGIRFSAWSTTLITDGKLDKDNVAAMSLVNSTISWISGAAFMGAFGAMLNAMKGEPPSPPVKTEETTTVVKASTEPIVQDTPKQ